MLTRFMIVVLVFAAFAVGLAELVRRTDQTTTQKDPMMACQEWSNPACGGQTVR